MRVFTCLFVHSKVVTLLGVGPAICGNLNLLTTLNVIKHHMSTWPSFENSSGPLYAKEQNSQSENKLKVCVCSFVFNLCFYLLFSSTVADSLPWKFTPVLKDKRKLGSSQQKWKHHQNCLSKPHP